MEVDEPPVAAFKLQGLQGGTTKKFNDVFGGLDDLELKHQVFEKNRAKDDAELDERLTQQGPSEEEMETVTPSFKKPGLFPRGDYHMNRGRGLHRSIKNPAQRDDDFQKPRGMPSRGRSSRGRYGLKKVPDYKLHPEKWTEYSLEDVDVSDASNKQAAFAFLQERKALKESEIKERAADVDGNACSKGLISFKKLVKNISNKSENDTGNFKQKQTMVEDSEKMESDDAEGVSGQKRKYEIDETEQVNANYSESVEIPTGFKSRKTTKRNIRSRNRDSEDSD